MILSNCRAEHEKVLVDIWAAGEESDTQFARKVVRIVAGHSARPELFSVWES
jgi:hypothetical protein